MSTKKEISKELTQALASGFPQDLGFTRISLPRLAMISQDITEGKGKAMKVVQEAGTFLKEYQTEELDTNGKKIWAEDELGSEIEGTIVYQRKQLKYYDAVSGDFTSSPIFDSAEDIVPLFCNKVEVARGTMAQLKAKYNYVDPKDGKTKSHLEENKVLYVLYKGELYQMTLRGSSMYSCKTFLKGVPNPTIFLTKFSSETKENGKVTWNQMTFVNIRPLTNDEAAVVLEKQNEIKESILSEKAYFKSLNNQPKVEDSIVPEDEITKLLNEDNNGQS